MGYFNIFLVDNDQNEAKLAENFVNNEVQNGYLTHVDNAAQVNPNRGLSTVSLCNQNLVLVRLNAGVKNDKQTLYEIVKLARDNQIPVVVINPYGTDEEALECFNLGVRCYVQTELSNEVLRTVFDSVKLLAFSTISSQHAAMAAAA
jgi:DNA-binding NarL/FixJ family response regulator